MNNPSLFARRARDERPSRADHTGSLDPVGQVNLERRVNALERTVEDINRRLRAAERDVTEIRAEIRDFRNVTTASFHVLREDFGDLRSHVDRGFAEMRGPLDPTASGRQHIADLIQRLIDEQNR